MGERNRRGTTREMKRGGGTEVVEALDGGGKLFAFHSLEKELGNVFTTPLVFGRDRRFRFPLLVLVMHGAEAIIGVHLLVLRFSMLCLDLPDTLLFQR
jgi:hypothetical protein